MNVKTDDLKHIRSMMERSSKCLSLSGLSGIVAGSFALMGAVIAYFIYYRGYTITQHLIYDLFLLAGLVLLCASISGVYFSMRNARKQASKFWMPATKQVLKDFSVPMLVGGLFCTLLIYHNSTEMVASAMLIFYGIALINAGAHTYRDIKFLGACEIALGFLAGVFTYNGLFFWAIGFGVLHIVYGIGMYFKYEQKSDKNMHV